MQWNMYFLTKIYNMCDLSLHMIIYHDLFMCVVDTYLNCFQFFFVIKAKLLVYKSLNGLKLFAWINT